MGISDDTLIQPKTPEKKKKKPKTENEETGFNLSPFQTFLSLIETYSRTALPNMLAICGYLNLNEIKLKI